MDEHISTVEHLARLHRAGSTGTVAPATARWALDVIARTVAASERLALRNHYIRTASDLIEGSVEAKAARLHAEAMTLCRSWHLRDAVADLASVRGCLQAALQIDKRTPLSARTLRRILSERGFCH